MNGAQMAIVRIVGFGIIARMQLVRNLLGAPTKHDRPILSSNQHDVERADGGHEPIPQRLVTSPQHSSKAASVTDRIKSFSTIAVHPFNKKTRLDVRGGLPCVCE